MKVLCSREHVLVDFNISSAPVEPTLRNQSTGASEVLCSTGAEERLKSTKTCSLEQRTFIAPVLIFLTIGSTSAIEIVDLISACIQRDRLTGRRNFRQSSDSPMLGASVKPVLLFFFVFNWIDLDLNVTSIVSSSKRCVNFYWPSWSVFERVCKISKANSILIKLLTHEPLLIVRSRTKNYKP